MFFQILKNLWFHQIYKQTIIDSKKSLTNKHITMRYPICDLCFYNTSCEISTLKMLSIIHVHFEYLGVMRITFEWVNWWNIFINSTYTFHKTTCPLFNHWTQKNLNINNKQTTNTLKQSRNFQAPKIENHKVIKELTFC